MNRKILQIAIPSIVSNITVPLLGLIDIAIVGHLGSAAYIGAIAVGGLMFNIIYWLFGFLRMGTSGMTSQAYGKRDLNEVTRILIRAHRNRLLHFFPDDYTPIPHTKTCIYIYRCSPLTCSRIGDYLFQHLIYGEHQQY